MAHQPHELNCTPSTDASKLERLKQDIVIETQLCGQHLRFHSTWGMFSPRAIDEGTQLLLDRVEVSSTARCIDLGCGYGPLGLTLAACAPRGSCHLIDKDFVAVEYASKNASINGLTNVDVYLSNGFSHVSADARFDLVVSNLPAKAGKELFYLFFLEARARMAPGAVIQVVTINGMRGFIKRLFGEIFGNYSKDKQGRSYTVSRASLD